MCHNSLFIKKNQQKLVFAWGVGISGMRTDS
ncbi:lytic transglycosylase, partial [Salmonella enterica subsp. enterica serovar Panama]